MDAQRAVRPQHLRLGGAVHEPQCAAEACQISVLVVLAHPAPAVVLRHAHALHQHARRIHRGMARAAPAQKKGDGALHASCLSMEPASLTSNLPGCSRLTDFTTPSSTSI